MSSHIDPLLDGQHSVLTALRALLNHPEDWPEEADHLLAHWNQLPQPGSTSDQENETLLSLAVDDALKGVDISIRYPAFFQQMLVDQDLQQAFLDTLDALEKHADNPSAIPTVPQHTFDFLLASTVKPIVEYVSPAKWRLTWQATLEQIQNTFFAAAQFEPAYRSDDYLEDAWFTLFRNEVEIDRAQASVVLEAVRLIATPDMLQLHIAVGITPDQSETTVQLPDLRAQLTWGPYDQVVTVTQRGRATFPSLPLNFVLDETHQHITSDLRLIVEPAIIQA